MTHLFFELIQITLANRNCFNRVPSDIEWKNLYEMACKQSLAGVLLNGVNRLIESGCCPKPPMNVLYEWIGLQQHTVAHNKLQNQRTKELCEFFKEHGYRCCVLKGQGTALYYENPEYRQCGDIDIWIEGDRDEILRFAQSKNYHIGHIDVKHSDIDFFKDVPVEVHFLPSWMYNPSTNKKLQKFFKEQSEKQFGNNDAKVGFNHTTIEFDLVFSIVHIYRHIFSEGIGLRQLMDYYFILQSSSVNQRKDAIAVLRSLKMFSFVGGIMWILKECFGMKEEYLLCVVNKRHGEYLLSEIMMAGNFGQYDDRMQRIDKNKKFKRGFVQLKRNLRFVSYYPSEVLWSPFWKLWHWGWRKRKGYL